jgi:transposase
LLQLLAAASGPSRRFHNFGRPLQIVLCYEVGYDGFWLARYLIARAIHL